MGKELVFAILNDPWSAPISARLRAMLRFLDVLISHPEQLGPSDADAAYQAGASEEDLRAAVSVCVLFQLMTRLADGLDYSTAGPDGSAFLLRLGYRV